MSEVLKAVADRLESLGQVRDYLAHLVRCGEQRPAWQPQQPELTCDQQLRGRLETCHTQLVREQEELKARRTELLQVEKANSPFICPTGVQKRIATFEALQAHAIGRNAQGLQSLSLQCEAGRMLGEPLKACVERLAETERRGLTAASRDHANRLAYAGTPFWRSERNEFIARHDRDWKTVCDHIQTVLQSAYTERRTMEARHDEVIERAVEALLTLPRTAAEARHLVAEVSAARECETKACEAVKRVWEGAQMVNRWAYRSGVEPREDDRTLAEVWAGNCEPGSYWAVAMESARHAELVALALYRELLGKAEDLSILQLRSDTDSRWRDADIEVDGRWVDVKNARRSFSSPNSYSEHTVRRLKTDRLGRDVVISGFLSPYHPEGGFHPAERVVWLGETTLGVVDCLRRDFETEYLQLDLDGDRLNLFPPWLFEYPDKCYAERDAALGAARSDGFVLPKSGYPPGLLVLSGRAGLIRPGHPLSDEAGMLTRRLTASAVPTRPVLFLHILDRFCQTARSGVPFPADALREILFLGDLDPGKPESPDLPPADSIRDISFSANSPTPTQFSADTTPLATFDPLKIVKSLLDVLEQVAVTRAHAASAFTRFRLAGPSILQGRQDHGGWQTLFAYCGGWRTLRDGRKVRCGQSPLYLGQNETCDECSRLVCHLCGHCVQSCQACPPRQAVWPLP